MTNHKITNEEWIWIPADLPVCNGDWEIIRKNRSDAWYSVQIDRIEMKNDKSRLDAT